jgi:NAD-dependent deacetylase sirtuin 1
MMSEPPKRQKLSHVNTILDVVELIRNSKNIIVLTGAGVSVSCGIPDFRSRDGIYSRLAQDFPDLPDPQVY